MSDKQQQQTDNPGEPMTPSQSQAEVIKRTSASAVLATCLSRTYGKIVESDGFRAYCDDIVAASGQPTDAIEKMMVEQLLLAHHRVGDLHAQSACADSAEVAALYNNASLRLMAEFRKTSLALREYRTPVAATNLTLVQQQNVAAGDQQIAFVDDKNNGEQREESDSRSKLGRNEPKAIAHEHPNNIFTQSAACGSRQAQPVEAGRTDASRAPAFAGSGIGQPAVDAFNWPENPGG